MSTTRALVVAALGLLIVACQSPASAPAPKAEATDPATAARQALERHDWLAAARLARQAIARDPASLSAHYSLAIAASYLDLRDEAIREFQWVMAHAPAGSQELQTARNWLAEAGLVPRTASAGIQDAAPAAGQATGSSTLYGRAMWAEPGQPPTPQRRLQLHLIGLPRTPTQEYRYILRTDDDGKFEFKNVVPGPYEVTNRIAGQPIWRLKVQLEPGGSTALDLTPDNSVKVRDDFPESSRPAG